VTKEFEMRIKRLAVCAIFVLGSVSGCLYSQEENRKLWYEEKDRADFIRELQARGIPFHVDREGGVWYPAKDVAQVDRISDVIVQRNTFEGVNFSDAAELSLFKKRLAEGAIPFQVRTRHGEEWITWDKKYDARANAIREQVERESLERLRAARSAVGSSTK
jgi:hypothetical protein